MQNREFFKKPLHVFLLAMLCCTLWGSAAPFIKWGYKLFNIEGVPSVLMFAGIRFMLAGLLVILFGSLLQKKVLIAKKENIQGICTLALFQTAGQYFFYYIGLSHTSGVNGSIISGTSAFISLLVASLIFHYEKITIRKAVGCFIGCLGILFMNISGASANFSLNGEGFVLMSQLCGSISAAFIKKFTQNQNAVLLSGYQFTLGGILLAIIGFLMGGRISFGWSLGLLVLIHLALVSAIAYTIWGLLLSVNPVSKIGVYMCVTPIIGVILSSIVLHESNQAFQLSSLIALLLVSLSVFLVNKETQTD